MWLLWSALSSDVPFQQSGKLTWRRRLEPLVSGQVGTLLERGTPDRTPQFQKVTRIAWGSCAPASPAIIFNLDGKVETLPRPRGRS
jgi:hypothetical protein